MKTVYLDVETKHLLDEFPGGRKDRSNIKLLKVAVAGTLCEGEYITWEEDMLMPMIKYLKTADLIVGHNVFSFDYKVLGGYFQYPEVILGTRQGGIVSKTFDTQTEFTRIINDRDVSWVSLDDIATRNFGMHKPHDAILIPQMWKDGYHGQVKEYLLNDLRMTEKFYLSGCQGTKIKYDHKIYGKSQGEREIYLKW
jgi:hypothetical protein